MDCLFAQVLPGDDIEAEGGDSDHIVVAELTQKTVALVLTATDKPKTFGNTFWFLVSTNPSGKLVNS